MNIRIFTVPLYRGEEILVEMNKFMDSHRVLEVREELITTTREPSWSFCIRYLKRGSERNKESQKSRVDYKEVLDEKTFAVYDTLRTCRKDLSNEAGVPVYAVFTNAELAKIAALPKLEIKQLSMIEGVAKGKVEKFGKRILELYHSKRQG